MKARILLLNLAIALSICSCAHLVETSDSTSCDHPGGPEDAQSTNLDADIRTMWSVAPKQEGRDWVTSTPEAVLAANRVFNTVKLEGLTRDQMEEKLRFDLRSPEYGYYAPFWPVARQDVPIRIDTGFYGWQFDIHFAPDQKVNGVTRRWIH